MKNNTIMHRIMPDPLSWLTDYMAEDFARECSDHELILFLAKWVYWLDKIDKAGWPVICVTLESKLQSLAIQWGNWRSAVSDLIECLVQPGGFPA